MREDVIGRANVEDTPELDRYYNELGQQESYALWTVANAIEPWEPKPSSQPSAQPLLPSPCSTSNSSSFSPAGSGALSSDESRTLRELSRLPRSPNGLRSYGYASAERA